MCQITAPSAPLVAGPLQAPTEWLIVAILLVLAVGVFTLLSWRFPRARPQNTGQKVVFALRVCAMLAMLMGIVILLLVYYPTLEAVTLWEDMQIYALRTNNCPASATAAVYTTWEHVALNGVVATWRNVGYGLQFGGVIASLLLTLLWFQAAPRTHPQPTRPQERQPSTPDAAISNMVPWYHVLPARRQNWRAHAWLVLFSLTLGAGVSPYEWPRPVVVVLVLLVVPCWLAINASVALVAAHLPMRPRWSKPVMVAAIVCVTAGAAIQAVGRVLENSVSLTVLMISAVPLALAFILLWVNIAAIAAQWRQVAGSRS